MRNSFLQSNRNHLSLNSSNKLIIKLSKSKSEKIYSKLNVTTYNENTLSTISQNSEKIMNTILENNDYNKLIESKYDDKNSNPFLNIFFKHYHRIQTFLFLNEQYEYSKICKKTMAIFIKYIGYLLVCQGKKLDKDIKKMKSQYLIKGKILNERFINLKNIKTLADLLNDENKAEIFGDKIEKIPNIIVLEIFANFYLIVNKIQFFYLYYYSPEIFWKRVCKDMVINSRKGGKLGQYIKYLLYKGLSFSNKTIEIIKEKSIKHEYINIKNLIDYYPTAAVILRITNIYLEKGNIIKEDMIMENLGKSKLELQLKKNKEKIDRLCDLVLKLKLDDYF